MSHRWLCGTETQSYEIVKLVLICKEGNPLLPTESRPTLSACDDGGVVAGVWLCVCMCLCACV